MALAKVSFRCEQIAVSEEAVINNLLSWAPEATFSIGRLLYYPYAYCHLNSEARTLFGGKLQGDVHVAVELVTGREATLAAPPVISEQELVGQDHIPARISLDEARQIAERFAGLLVNHRIKLLRAPRVTWMGGYCFYRPFLVASGKAEESEFDVLVDLVSGQFHPLDP